MSTLENVLNRLSMVAVYLVLAVIILWWAPKKAREVYDLWGTPTGVCYLWVTHDHQEVWVKRYYAHDRLIVRYSMDIQGHQLVDLAKKGRGCKVLEIGSSL